MQSYMDDCRMIIILHCVNGANDTMNPAMSSLKNPIFKILIVIFFILTVMKIHTKVRTDWKSKPYKFPEEKSNLSHSLTSKLNVFGNTLGTDSSILVKTFYNKTIQPPGVILNVKGGIGNQLFQYACSYALARDLEWPLYFYHAPTPPSKSHRGFQSKQRELALDQFKVSLDNIIDASTMNPVGIYYQSDRQFMEQSFLHSKDIDKKFVSLTGAAYCQSREYWGSYQDEIKSMFQPHEWAINAQKLKQIVNKIESAEESVVVHVRRGDFTRVSGFYVPLSYQRHAIRRIISMLNDRGKKNRPVFFIFSDDIMYVKEKLKDFGEKYELVFVAEEVSNSTSIEEFYLMTLCKHIILPNSTYSWWAAYLMKNVDKIVIASTFNPSFFRNVVAGHDWFVVEQFGKLYHPKEWIVIDPFSGGLVKSS